MSTLDYFAAAAGGLLLYAALLNKFEGKREATPPPVPPLTNPPEIVRVLRYLPPVPSPLADQPADAVGPDEIARRFEGLIVREGLFQ